MLILSADPGITGAICAYDTVEGRVQIHDMPVVEKSIATGIRRVLDEVEILVLLGLYKDLGSKHFFLEQVNGLPGQSAPRAFNFGWGYGVLRVAALAAGMQLHTVPPATWKAAMRAPKEKLASIQRASELLPHSAKLWAKGTGDAAQRGGRAEAAMLALYAERVLGNRT
jgi:hypothetical protein